VLAAMGITPDLISGAAMVLGRKVYDKACAACHGADLKGIPDQHTPDLTDSEWQYSGSGWRCCGSAKSPNSRCRARAAR
jgi:mono/diheme cytochrome c family protein